jgi:serine/threonine protein kinase
MTEPRRRTDSNPAMPQADPTRETSGEGTSRDRKAPPAEPVDLRFLGTPLAAGELGRVGGYRVLELLGQGGMGLVFRAEDPHLRRPVALKLMCPEVAADPLAADRFLREARTAAAVKHDHIVTIYQVGQDRGMPFIAMEFLRGEALDARIRRLGRLLPFEVMRVGYQTALGLAAAHEAGLVHRDIKPGNVWLEAPDDRVKVLDFGLARLVRQDADTGLTRTGTVVGTPAYMSPEQASGKPVDARSDLFSLGAMLYRAATGRLPFPGNSPLAILAALATATPTPPRELVPEIPPQLDELIRRLLAKDPADRPQTAREVAEALAPAARTVTVVQVVNTGPTADTAFAFDDDPAQAHTAPVARKPWPRWVPFVAAGLLGLVGVALGGWIIIKIRNPDGTETELKVPDTAKVQISGNTKNVKVEPPRKEPEKPPPQKATPVAFAPLPDASPLDALDPSRIPAAERFDWQPKELVAVVGSSQHRHWGGIHRVVYSPKGNLIATTGNDFTVRLWDADTLEPKGAIRGYPAMPEQLGAWFSPDGSTLAVWRNDQPIPNTATSLYDVQQSPPKKLMDIPAHAMFDPFFPDGKRLLLHSMSLADTQVWDISGEAPKLVKEFPKFAHGASGRFVLHEDRLLIITVHQPKPEDNMAILWDIRGDAPKELARLQLETPEVGVSPDGKRLAVSTPDQTRKIRVFDITGDTFIENGTFEIESPGRAYLLTFVPGTDDLAFATVSGNWGIRDLKASQTRKFASDLPCTIAMAFAPGGKRMAARSASIYSLLATFDMAADGTATLRNNPDLTDDPLPAADGSWAVSRYPVVTRWHLAGPAPTPQPIKRAGSNWAVTSLLDGRVVARIPGTQMLSLFDLRKGDGADPELLPSHAKDLFAALASPGGKWLAISRNTQGDRSPVLIDLKKSPPEVFATLTEHPSYPGNAGVSLFEFSRDENFLLSWTGTYIETHLWDLRGEKPRHLDSPKDAATGHPLLHGHTVTLAVDRPVVVVGNFYGGGGASKVRLLDYSTGDLKESFTMQPSEQPVAGAVLLPGGTTLMACDDTGLIRFVEVPSGKVLREWKWPGPVRLQLALDGRHVFALRPYGGGGPLYILRLAEASPKPEAPPPRPVRRP